MGIPIHFTTSKSALSKVIFTCNVRINTATFVQFCKVTVQVTKSTVEAQRQLEIKGWDEKTSSNKRLKQKKSLHKNGCCRNSTEEMLLLSSLVLASFCVTVYCVIHINTYTFHSSVKFICNILSKSQEAKLSCCSLRRSKKINFDFLDCSSLDSIYHWV